MSLLDGKKKEPVNQMDIAADASKGVDVSASKDTPKGVTASATTGEKPVEGKQLSSAAAYQRRKKEKIRQGAKRILANKVLMAKMDATDVAFIKWLDSEPGTASLGGGSVFTKLFGNSPKVGDKITLQDAFDRTFKGKGQMDGVMKKLKEKNGIEIEFVFNKEKPALSTYEIKSLGTPAAEKEAAEKATA